MIRDERFSMDWGRLSWVIGIPSARGSLYSGMAWVYLLAAGICEIVWAIGLKKSEGFTRPWTTAWTVVVMLLSFWLLSYAMKTLPLGTAYAVWTGIGAVGTVLFGIVFMGEPKDLARLGCIVMIVVGIVGLKVVSGSGR